MRILFVTNYFPPEVNAPATRVVEHGRVWAEEGHQVEVLTAVPHFPEGRIHAGYRNRLTREELDGVDVLRVPMYTAANRGTVRRTLSYLSFMLSSVLHGRRLRRRPDVVVATSPQFFAGLAGWWIARRLRVPFVLEVRDLWPDSIVAVGALPDSPVIRLFRRLERFLYERAAHIVVVTDAFQLKLQEKRVPAEKISVVKNGVDLEAVRTPSPERREELRRELGLEGRFVVSYVGTLGMAHRADVLLEAAERSPDPDVLFLLVGAGSEAEAIAERARALPNVRVLEKRPRNEALELVALSDASVVHLRRSPLFTTVIPSKMFEAMALGTPILLGVKGEAREILAKSGAGLPFEPENPDALLDRIRELRSDPELRSRLSRRGPPFVAEHFDRRVLARRYLEVLEKTPGNMASPRRGEDLSVGARRG